MPFTRTWDDNRPLGAAASHTLDDEIRYLRQDLRERLEQLLGIPSFDDDPLKISKVSPSDGTNTTELDTLSVGSVSANAFYLKSAGVARWTLTNAGILHPYVTNAYDLGTTAYPLRNVITRKIESDDTLNIVGGSPTSSIILNTNGAARYTITDAGHIVPANNDAYDIGTTGLRVRNLYISNAVWTPNVGSNTAVDVGFYQNNVSRLQLTSTTLRSSTDLGIDLGGAANRFKHLHVQHINAYGQTHNVEYNAGSNPATIDANNGNVQRLTINGSFNLTINNLSAGSVLTIGIIRGAAGSISWNNINWGSAGAPTLSTGIGKIDVINVTNIAGTMAGSVAGLGY